MTPPPVQTQRKVVKPDAPVALRLKGVHCAYGPIGVLHGIDLEIREGEIVTLIGANGAGKSTTLNTVCGLVKTGAGQIELFGTDITGYTPQAIVGMGVSQSPEGRRLFSDLTVLENLRLGAYLRKDEDAIAADLAHVLELFPILSERSEQLAGSLSGGEQQMCAIARCLMARPKVMLLDEPSLGLAPLICKQIFDTVRTLNEEGTTIFLVEQNAQAALKLAHRGYVMETGHITMEGKGADLLADPKVQEAYLGI